MSLSPRFLDELRSRVTLSDIVGQSVRLTRAGREYKGCCPFHKEKTPSFTVNNDKQFYHCFGCGAHGDAIGFLMQDKGQSFIEAVENLAARAGIEVPKATPQERQKEEKRKDLHQLMDAATAFMQDQLESPENRDVMTYMTGRSFSTDILSAFRVGYAPADGQAIRKYLKAEGFDDAQMIEAGVLRTSQKGGDPYAFFRDRVMFPVTDKRGRVVAFGGRILPENIRPPAQGDFTPPKYINSSDTTLFHKGRMLYGEALARQAAYEGHTILVVEGYLDVMACYQAGIRGAVAPLGTALTEDQIASLWTMGHLDEEKNPVLCFDGDNAGRRAAARAVERILPLLKPGKSVRLAFLPEGEDPDTYIKNKGRDSFVQILKTAIPLHQFIWEEQTEGRDFSTPESRAGLAETLEKIATQIGDRAVQNYYRQALRDKLWEAFRYSAKQKSGGRGGASQPNIALKKPVAGQHKNAVRLERILATLINHPAQILEFEEQLSVLTEGAENYLELLHEMMEFAGEISEKDLDTRNLKDHLNANGYGQLLEALSKETMYVHAPYARPKCEAHDVAEGLQDLFDRMAEERLLAEVGQAGRKMSAEFGEDAQERLLEMRKLLGGGSSS